MGKSLQKVICNGLFLSDKGMICSMSFAVLAEQLFHCSGCLVIATLYNAAPMDFVKEFLTTFAALSEGLSAYGGSLKERFHSDNHPMT